MKLSNLFKRSKKEQSGIIIKQVDKTQLSKVIGGVDATDPSVKNNPLDKIGGTIRL